MDRDPFTLFFNEPCPENPARVKKCAELMIPLAVGLGSGAHLSGGSAWKDGFDHDSGAPAPDDAKAEPLAVVGQLNQLHVAPLTCWRLKESGGGDAERGKINKEESLGCCTSNTPARLLRLETRRLIYVSPPYLVRNGREVSPHGQGAGDPRRGAVLDRR